MSGGWESYFIPGTKVLKNRLGLDDAEELRILEEKFVFLRIAELDSAPVEGAFDYAHFKAIHRRLFQDVYEWAGEERTAPTGQFMIKAGHAYYPAGPEMTKAAEKLFAGLAKDDFLRGLEIDEFVAKLAELWGELNVVHSFREGNTRTQTVFFDSLATAAGYQLDVERLASDSRVRAEFIAARFHSQDTGDNAQLEEVLRGLVVKRGV
ncbi:MULTISPECIES: Fic family protein [unclassified Corynebacterium]|uniref:Fic/DOC family protein n=1 Tax=unclassified Corynebacterium TaxID=2624378 RepID=UPI0008A33A1E|nr:MULTISPECIES: Fic family protein [unclassified Corynebacterium]OFN37331.1 cell filamentation protein Fic [Corynebacterium sp. HMSC072A04]OFO94528.1 cell filamentation protein Fic [Corynebacterium sp. HMSC034H07]OFP32272.1 cell filamentation protein Fic [Corynebacterium sp. HMSC068G04]